MIKRHHMEEIIYSSFSMLIVLLFIFIGSTQSTFAGVNIYKSEVVEQVEVSIHLKPEKAIEVAQRYAPKSKARQDYYLDMYDGKSLLISSNIDGYRFRLKSRKGKSVFQIGRNIEEHVAVCDNKRTFIIKRKRVGELQEKNKEHDFSVHTLRKQLKDIERGHSSATQSIFKVHHLVSNLKIPFLNQLRLIAKNKKWFFVAEYSSQKRKSNFILNKGYGPVKASITMAEDYIGAQYIQERAELEFQINNFEEMSPQQFIKTICSFTDELDLQAADMAPDRKDIDLETLTRLQKYNEDLGL